MIKFGEWENGGTSFAHVDSRLQLQLFPVENDETEME